MKTGNLPTVIKLIERQVKRESDALRSCWDQVASRQAVYSIPDPKLEGTYASTSTSRHS